MIQFPIKCSSRNKIPHIEDYENCSEYLNHCPVSHWKGEPRSFDILFTAFLTVLWNPRVRLLY